MPIFPLLDQTVSPPPHTRSTTVLIFASKRAINCRLVSTSACSASISATMVRWVSRSGAGIVRLPGSLSDLSLTEGEG
jgi:hypothetical protein